MKKMNDLGGLTNITNQSEIPNCSAAFEINRKRAIEYRKIDPLWQLVSKLKQGKTERATVYLRVTPSLKMVLILLA